LAQPYLRAIATTNDGNDAGKQEPLYTFGGNVNLYCHYGNQHGDSSKAYK
jgi:hypothetical protein